MNSIVNSIVRLSDFRLYISSLILLVIATAIITIIYKKEQKLYGKTSSYNIWFKRILLIWWFIWWALTLPYMINFYKVNQRYMQAILATKLEVIFYVTVLFCIVTIVYVSYLLYKSFKKPTFDTSNEPIKNTKLKNLYTILLGVLVILPIIGFWLFGLKYSWVIKDPPVPNNLYMPTVDNDFFLNKSTKKLCIQHGGKPFLSQCQNITEDVCKSLQWTFIECVKKTERWITSECKTACKFKIPAQLH